jgi:hypothetical protein
MADLDQANGWFQKHMVESLKNVNDEMKLIRGTMNNEIVLLRSAIGNVKDDMTTVHTTLATIGALLGVYKWLMGGLIVTLMGMVISLLLIVAKISSGNGP